MHKNVSLPRERERERLLIPRINPSSIRLEGKKKSKRRERKDHTDLTCYSHATLRIDYPPTNYHRCSIPVYTRGSFEDVAETGSRRTRGIQGQGDVGGEESVGQTILSSSNGARVNRNFVIVTGRGRCCVVIVPSSITGPHGYTGSCEPISGPVSRRNKNIPNVQNRRRFLRRGRKRRNFHG